MSLESEHGVAAGKENGGLAAWLSGQGMDLYSAGRGTLTECSGEWCNVVQKKQGHHKTEVG